MTVKELIKKLQGVNQDLQVFIPNPEWGPELAGSVSVESPDEYYFRSDEAPGDSFLYINS